MRNKTSLCPSKTGKGRCVPVRKLLDILKVIGSGCDEKVFAPLRCTLPQNGQMIAQGMDVLVRSFKPIPFDYVKAGHEIKSN